MVSIAIVVPSWRYWTDPLKFQPLAELHYATLILERCADVTVSVIDLRRAAGDPPTRINTACDAYLYWVCKSADALEIHHHVAHLRLRFPEAKHLAGGTHVEHMADRSAEIFDAIFQGSGELALLKAVEDLRNGRLQNRYITSTPCHFRDFSHPRRDFIPTERIVNQEHFKMYGGVAGTGAYFSRGCGFKCRFCVYNNPPNFEYRDGNQITDEIEYLKRDYGIKGVNLRDEVCIPINRRHAVTYLEAIGKCGVIWKGQSVPFGSEDMVVLAAEAGLQEVALGIESVDSDQVLEISNKPSKSIDNNRRYIELLQKHGIKVKVCLIFGLPGESSRVVDRTIQFLENVAPDFVALSGFDPVPGSAFYQTPAAYGIRTIEEDLSKHTHLIHRFGDEDDDLGLPFEFEPQGPWGPALSRKQIRDNIKTVQSWLRERNMSY